MIDRGYQRCQLGLIGLQFDAGLERAADGGTLHLLRNFFERIELASLQKKQHQQQHRRDTEQQAEQGDYRHQDGLFKRCFPWEEGQALPSPAPAA